MASPHWQCSRCEHRMTDEDLHEGRVMPHVVENAKGIRTRCSGTGISPIPLGFDFGTPPLNLRSDDENLLERIEGYRKRMVTHSPSIERERLLWDCLEHIIRRLP